LKNPKINYKIPEQESSKFKKSSQIHKLYSEAYPEIFRGGGGLKYFCMEVLGGLWYFVLKKP